MDKENQTNLKKSNCIKKKSKEQVCMDYSKLKGIKNFTAEDMDNALYRKAVTAEERKKNREIFIETMKELNNEK